MKRRASFLLYAAVQFVVATALAMLLYPGGYDLVGNFFSDLGATETLTRDPKLPSLVLFVLALASMGAAFIGFAGAWRGSPLDRGAARGAAIAAHVAGTLSGLAYIGIACTPVNLVMRTHNTFVLAAFGNLLVYVACSTVWLWRNRAGAAVLVPSIAYVVLVLAYVVLVLHGRGSTEWTLEERHQQVVAQKIVVYASMVYIVYLTARVRAM